MNHAIEIRQATPDDVEHLALIGRATFLETFAGLLDGGDIVGHCLSSHAPEVYRDWLGQDRSRTWLLSIQPGGAPIGYLVMAQARLPLDDLASDDLEIKRIYLLHRFARMGLGGKLLDTAIACARSLGAPRLLLGVFAQNDNALAFYQRAGFVQVGRRTFPVGQRTYEDKILSLVL